MRRLFGLPVAARPAALRAMYGADGGATWGPGTMMVMAHESGDAFRVGVDDPRYTAALDRLVDADAWGQIERRLHEAWAYQRSHAPQAEHPESIDVWLALGNPDDPLFLEGTLGY